MSGTQTIEDGEGRRREEKRREEKEKKRNLRSRPIYINRDPIRCVAVVR
jgi:hypothetical protein